MRLIDAGKYPCRGCTITQCHENCDKFNDWLNTPVRSEVVYCKDCAYYDKPSGECPMCCWTEDEEFGMEWFSNNAKPDWFCSEGVRK